MTDAPRHPDLTLQAGFVIACNFAPYFGLALFRMKRTATTAVATMASDRHWRLFWNPDYIATLTPHETAALLLHEVHHLLRDHAHRYRSLAQTGPGEASLRKWNYATDLLINHDLTRQGVTLPEGLLTVDSSLIRGIPIDPEATAEHNYRVLCSHLPPDPPTLACGSGSATGEPGPGGDSDTESEGLDEGVADLIRRRVAAATVAHINAHGRSSVPGGVQRWARDTLNPTVDWRSTLRSALTRSLGHIAGHVDYTYRKPSRRRAPGIVLPALTAPVPPVIDVVIDTSASVSDAELNQALTEVAAIMRGHAAQHPLRVRWCDASATQGLFLTAGNLRDVFATARGGGGTDIAAGIAAAAHDTPRPGIIIALTDGRTAWPPRPPLLGPHYIAAVFDTGTPPMTPPPWLTSIRIPVPTAALNR